MNKNTQKNAMECNRLARAKYDSKTYKTYSLKFRKDEDADLIELIEKLKADGTPLRTVLRNLIEK